MPSSLNAAAPTAWACGPNAGAPSHLLPLQKQFPPLLPPQVATGAAVAGAAAGGQAGRRIAPVRRYNWCCTRRLSVLQLQRSPASPSPEAAELQQGSAKSVLSRRKIHGLTMQVAHEWKGPVQCGRRGTSAFAANSTPMTSSPGPMHRASELKCVAMWLTSHSRLAQQEHSSVR